MAREARASSLRRVGSAEERRYALSQHASVAQHRSLGRANVVGQRLTSPSRVLDVVAEAALPTGKLSEFHAAVASELETLKGKLLKEHERVVERLVTTEERHVLRESPSGALGSGLACVYNVRPQPQSLEDDRADLFLRAGDEQEAPWKSSERPEAPKKPWETDTSSAIELSPRRGSGVSEPVCKVRDIWLPSEDLLRSRATLHNPRVRDNTLDDMVDLEVARVVRKIQSWMVQSRQIKRSPLDRRLRLQTNTRFSGTMSFREQGARLWRWRLGASLPMSPHTPARICWDVLCMALLLFDAITIPLILLVMTRDTLGVGAELLVSIFWTFDMLMSLLTATYVDNELAFNFSAIVKRYAKTWLVPDFTMVSMEWVALMMDRTRGGLTFLRWTRILRAARLIRLVKMENIVRKHVKTVNSMTVLHMLHLVQTIFAFFLVNHVIGCIWYAIGGSEHGWLGRVMKGEVEVSIEKGYLMALHWSMTQFHGSTEIMPDTIAERAFAVGVLLVGMLSFSVLVSFVTDMLLQLRQAHKKLRVQKLKLRAYFLRHEVPMELMVSVKRYLENHATRGDDSAWEEDRVLLHGLPVQLQKTVLLEARQPTIEDHKLLHWLLQEHHTAFRDVCHSAISAMLVNAGDSVFAVGDACQQMYFVEAGTLTYLHAEAKACDEVVQQSGPASQRSSTIMPGQRLAKKHCICEPALWVEGWQNRGDLRGISDCNLIFLGCDVFAKVLVAFPATRLDVSMYARWAVSALQLQGTLSDLWAAEVS